MSPVKTVILLSFIAVLGFGFGRCSSDVVEKDADPSPSPTVSEKEDPTPSPSEGEEEGDEQGPPSTPPDLQTDFSSQTDALFMGYALTGGGRVQMGVEDLKASDGKVAQVLFPGDPSLGFNSKKGPGFGTHLESYELFHFGTYRFRVQPAACDLLDEGVVTGIFTYWNEGMDENNNGIIDNSEIDFEFLCAEPESIYMTIWTDYSSGDSFLKATKKVNLRTGETLETPPGGEGQWDLVEGPPFPVLIPDFDATEGFIELSLTWAPASIRYTLCYEGEDIELWQDTNAAHIPQHPAYVMMNVWHSASHWDGSGQADYPSQDVLLKVDWFQFFYP